MNYISVKEAAAQWGVTIQMVRRYCQKGMIPQVIQENGRWRIPEGTVRPGTPEPVAVETKQSSLVTQINAQRKKNNHFGIYEYLQVNLAYSSNRMASNRLTREQVEDLYRTNKLSVSFGPTKVDDIIEIMNHFICTKEMVDTIMEPLSPSLIRRYHYCYQLMSKRHITICCSVPGPVEKPFKRVRRIVPYRRQSFLCLRRFYTGNRRKDGIYCWVDEKEVKGMVKGFDSREFQMAYHTHLPLGAFCSRKGTLFRLWAPTARQVTLRLYQAGTETVPEQTFFMQPREKGVWEREMSENLDGIYYDYAVQVDGKCYETPDPYGIASGVNGQRSMVLDLRRTDPEDWQQDKAPEKTAEQIIYELHIKDFSWDVAGGFDEKDRGKYTAFTKTGTTLWGRGEVCTGLDYLKQLGVTHVQLLPMFDYGSVDERSPEKQYNWGYDPVNYNVPEGSYSSDPYHGQVRVRELKQMIKALHDSGLRVIMDVVYNHTYSLDSPLFKTVPWYFYRKNSDGTPSNGSGCGNDIASQRSMCARYILDSVLYWAEEYHMDGFRFDLMGLLDIGLMEQIQKALDERYGAGEKLIYGEPWRAGSTAVSQDVTLCDKGALKKVNSRIGAFCDDTRDAVKGSVMDAEGVGFVNGGTITAEKLKKCVAGWSGEYGDFRTPEQTISYLSCHDDWTLWDKLVYTMDPDKNFTGNDPFIRQINRLAVAICFSCQGRLFIHAGEEFGRTKGGIKNSYCSSPDVNRLDWQRAWENRNLVDYYRGLIALRKQLPGLQDKTEAACKRILRAIDVAHNCAAVLLDNRGADSCWQQLYLCFNCGMEARELTLPDGSWQILVDGEDSFLWKKEIRITKKAMVPSKSALLLGK